MGILVEILMVPVRVAFWLLFVTLKTLSNLD